ncbi:hypothetical protein D3C71_1119660 [compost metagenome]
MFGFRPVNAVLTNTVVMHHRTAESDRLFADDFVQRIMVFINFVFRLAVHHVVVVDEVHVGAVDVAVGRVSAEHGDVIDVREFSTDAVNDALVNLVDAAPVAGYFSGEAHVASFEDLHAFCGHFFRAPVEVVEPVFDKLAVHAGALRVARHDLGDAFTGGARHARIAFGHKDHHAFAFGKMGEVLCAVFGVVQTRNRRTIAFDHHFAQDLKAGFHLVEDVAVVEIVFRGEFEDFHCDFSDVAQRPLVTNDDMANIRASSTARHVLDARNGAVRQHRLQPDDHIFNRAVQGRKLADTASRHQTAHLRQRFRLRRVARGVAFGAQGVFQHFQRHTALGRRLHVFDINIDDFVHPGAVEHQRIFHHRFQSAFRRGSPSARNAVNFVLIHKRQHVRNLLGGAEFDHRRRQWQGEHAVDIGKFSKAVDAVFLQYVFIGHHALGADNFFYLFNNCFAG